ncbi:type VII secretion integral membrane protein EccD [Gordonia sp. NPDC003425]
MTSVDTAPASGVGPGRERRPARTDVGIEPALVRVSVLGGNTQLDVGLPAAIPVAALIPELVAQIESRSPVRRDPDDPESDPGASPGGRPHDRQHRWTLALVGGGDPIAPNRSLSESGIRDGDLLILQSVRTGETPILFDDVVDAVARLNESGFSAWSATAARNAGYVVALAASLIAAVSLGAARIAGTGSWVAALSGVAAVGFLVAAVIVARHYRDALTATVLSATAMPLVFVSGMLIPPGGYGAAHLGLGAALVLLAATLSYRVTAVGPVTHSALTSAALLGALACVGAMVWEGRVPEVAAVTAAVGLAVIGMAPRATILLAKLPLPPVPTAGAPIDLDAAQPAPAIEGIGAIGAMALPKADALERRSRLANAYLTGIVGGVTLITATAAVLAADPLSGFDAKRVIYAAVIGAALCLRGRSHSDLAQASTLIAGGTATLLAVTVGLAFGAHNWPVVGFAVAVAIAIGAFVLGVIAPQNDFSPVMRRSAEIVEYILLALVVPLLLWVLDLYQMVREI